MKIFKDLWCFFKAEKKGYGVGLLALFYCFVNSLDSAFNYRKNY
ncbi:hypothetical protein LMG8520_1221 [Lactococcus lactis subsp. lactis]|uniref:Uncharacterized protein n=1 Tax=Lactococcus lactis subsp. lactis TaxID=1360 RepID=A0A0V8D954_LACLL|nr:hypothetical protein LMG8520_1221 [Lactococcus lactis subsp. lactis]